MLVRCVSAQPNGDRWTTESLPSEGWDLELGREYLVYGIRILGGLPWLDVRSDFGYIYAAPFDVFDVVDGRLPSDWVVGRVGDDGFAVWPEPFWSPYFHDDLIEGNPTRVQTADHVQRVLARLHWPGTGQPADLPDG